MKPPDGVHHNMCLPLHSDAVDSSAFTESSSASSASPDSMRSLSSLSGGRTDSPVDVDMPEGVPGRKVTTSEDDSGIQSPDCRPENDNDNSVSIYLDADEDGWCEIHDDGDNVTLVLTHDQNDNHSSGVHRRRSSDDSSATDALCCSRYEEDDDEEEDSFLSLTSVDVVMRCQNESEEGQAQTSSRKASLGPVTELYQEALKESMELHTENGQMQNSTRRPDMGQESELPQEALQESMELCREQGQMQSSNLRPGVGPESELPQEAIQEQVEPYGEECQEALQESMEFHPEEGQIQSSSRWPNVSDEEALRESVESHDESPSQLPSEVSLSETELPQLSEDSHNQDPQTTLVASTTLTGSPCIIKENVGKFKDHPVQAQTRPATKPSITKSTKTEVKRFPRPDLRNVKPKVISRAASVPRPANPSESTVGAVKKPPPTRGRTANRKDQDIESVVKKSRSSSNQARVTLPALSSEPKPKTILCQTEEKPSPCVSGASSSAIIVSGDQEQSEGLEVMEVVKEETECFTEEATLEVSAEETPKDMDQVSNHLLITSPLRNPRRFPLAPQRPRT